MFLERVEVRFRFSGERNIAESIHAAKWIQSQVDKEFDTWMGPDPLKFERLKARKGADIPAINKAFMEALETCPEWQRYRILRRQAFEKYNGGRWVPIRPQILRVD